jgi:hypothetical protein
MLQSQTHADHVRGDAAADFLLVRDLLVGGTPGVDDEGLGVANVGEVEAELEVVEDGLDLVDVAGDAEGEDCAWPLGQDLLGAFLVPVRGQARVVDPDHALVGFEPLAELDGVFDVVVTPERDRLEALQEGPDVEGRHAGPEVAHRVHAELRREGFEPVWRHEEATKNGGSPF